MGSGWENLKIQLALKGLKDDKRHRHPPGRAPLSFLLLVMERARKSLNMPEKISYKGSTDYHKNITPRLVKFY